MKFNKDEFKFSELNSLQPQRDYRQSPVSEIFSAILDDKEVNKYNSEQVDKTHKYIKHLAKQASEGDGRAKVELNAVTTVAIETPLLKRLQILDIMGNVLRVGYNEELRYKVRRLDGQMSGFQASQGDVKFPTSRWETRTLGTQTISGGLAINYREVANGNYDGINLMKEQVITDMMNQIFNMVITDLYNGVQNANIPVRHFVEAQGIAQQAVDDTITAIRRWGRVTMLGDYSVTSQLIPFAGFDLGATFDADNRRLGYSEAVMEEVRKTGLLSMYKGTPIVEIPNAYDETRLNANGDNFETYLPEGLLFFIPNGENNALQIGFRGGLQSASGFNVENGTELTRFDMEVGTLVIPEYVSKIGIVSDSDFTV